MSRHCQREHRTCGSQCSSCSPGRELSSGQQPSCFWDTGRDRNGNGWDGICRSLNLYCWLHSPLLLSHFGCGGGGTNLSQPRLQNECGGVWTLNWLTAPACRPALGNRASCQQARQSDRGNKLNRVRKISLLSAFGRQLGCWLRNSGFMRIALDNLNQRRASTARPKVAKEFWRTSGAIRRIIGGMDTRNTLSLEPPRIGLESEGEASE